MPCKEVSMSDEKTVNELTTRDITASDTDLGTYQKKPDVRNVLRTTEIVGSRVVNSNGEKLGKIENIMLDLQHGCIAYAVMMSGGVFGLGHKHYPIPIGALTYDDTDREFILSIDVDKMKDAPSFHPDTWPNMNEKDWGEMVHKHYDITPYWGV